MSYYIGCDAHKRYSQFAVLDEEGKLYREVRVPHDRGCLKAFLQALPEPAQVALETVGNWYWIVDEIEAAGFEPQLVHAAKAKVMMGNTNKTDKLDAKGLATLQKVGTLPTVWIAPVALRDERELHRSRMVLSRIRTRVKNRIHATLAKYAIVIEEASDIFRGKGRQALQSALKALPQETARCLEQMLLVLDELSEQIQALEVRILQRVEQTPNIQRLKTLPGVGDILAIVIEREVGTVERFSDNERFAGYSGTTPKVRSSGGKSWHGTLRQDVNHYLKWAFVEAANVVSRHQNSAGWAGRHVTILYKRIRRRKGHAKAVGAVARHLSEAAFWILKKGEPYKEPKARPVLPKPR